MKNLSPGRFGNMKNLSPGIFVERFVWIFLLRSFSHKVRLFKHLMVVCGLGFFVWTGCVIPSLRTGVGVSMIQSSPVAQNPNPPNPPNPSTGERSWTPGLALDVMAGFQIFTPGSFWGVTTELGYSLDSQLFPGKFVSGVGVFLKVPLGGLVGWATNLVTPTGVFGIGYHFHVIAAGHPEGLRGGIRNTVYFHALYSLLNLEFQYEYYPGDFVSSMHNVRVVLGVNLVTTMLFLMSRGRKR